MATPKDPWCCSKKPMEYQTEDDTDRDQWTLPEVKKKKKSMEAASSVLGFQEAT